MEPLLWIGLIGGTLFLIWYGYGLLVRRPQEEASPADGSARCHLCRRELPLREMVTREKIAGFENHFCGDCIEELHRDWMERHSARPTTRSMPGHN